MVNWTQSMQQYYEYYTVDPDTWRDTKKIDTVKSCTVSRDATAETLGSASIEVTESLGECYIRVYLVTIQNGVKERHPLGTFLIQTPSSSHDGKTQKVTIDAYTPLIELKENKPPLGYSLMKNENVMEHAAQLVQTYSRAPVIDTRNSINLYNDFVANTDDTWLSYIIDLIANAKYLLDLDELGRILFAPKQDMASLQPVWTYTDDNSSIIQPGFSIDHDMYGIPNVIEVIYSSDTKTYYSRVVNDDPNSPISTVNRGREITTRITDPKFTGDPTQEIVDDYAKQTLRDLSSLEYTITYVHGYCPVRVGDCIRLDYAKAGLNNIKAKVISQSIKCEPGCPVTEKAAYTVKLWG